jgi:hypothetical protein
MSQTDVTSGSPARPSTAAAKRRGGFSALEYQVS